MDYRLPMRTSTSSPSKIMVWLCTAPLGQSVHRVKAKGGRQLSRKWKRLVLTIINWSDQGCTPPFFLSCSAPPLLSEVIQKDLQNVPCISCHFTRAVFKISIRKVRFSSLECKVPRNGRRYFPMTVCCSPQNSTLGG